MKKIVKCPLCGKLQQTRGKRYFRCCQAAWEVEKCLVTDYDDVRYTTGGKRSSEDEDYVTIVDEDGRELSENEIENVVQNTVKKCLEKPKIKQKPVVENLNTEYDEDEAELE